MLMKHFQLSKIGKHVPTLKVYRIFPIAFRVARIAEAFEEKDSLNYSDIC